MRKHAWIVVLVVAVLLNGCMSTYSLMQHPRPYGGVRTTLDTLGESDLLTGIIFVLDLPLSFVLDTLSLPVTGIAALEESQ